MSTAQHIVIVGGDLSAPMAAAYLGRYLPASRFKITFIEAKTLARPEWCSSTYADIRKFNRALKIGETEFIQCCGASFKLGETYRGWGPAPYINSFIEYGATIGGIGFVALMLQQERLSSLNALTDYALPVKASLAGKFLPPEAKGRPILSDYDYGYHFNPQAYADLLIEKAQGFGVEISTDPAIMDGADLVINASGAPLDDTASFISWAQYGFGRSYTARTLSPQNDDLSLTTHITAKATGWTFYASNQTIDAEVEVFFDAGKGQHKYECGRLEQPWLGNVLNIGGAALTIEPIMGSPLRMMQHDLERLVKLFPPVLKDPVERQEYNRLTNNNYDRLRDYHSLQYKTSTAKGAGWDKRREMVIPKTAKYTLDLFKARANLTPLDEDHLFTENWSSLFLGQNIIPERYNALADSVEQVEIDTQLTNISSIIKHAVDSMPTHEDFIAKHCPAEGYSYTKRGNG